PSRAFSCRCRLARSHSRRSAERTDMSRITLIPLALLAIVTAREARAVDGVIEINTAKATAGGINGSLVDDPAGFPVTITKPGSYRLTGELSPLGVSAIAVSARGVTLDLNGFRISAFSGSAGVEGVDATGQTDIRVSNGVIEGFGGGGILTGDRARLEHVEVR